MITLIGIFIYLFSVVLDDGSTIISFLRGLSSLESNPIYVYFGAAPFFMAMAAFHIMLVLGFALVVNNARIAYMQKSRAYKIYDIMVFVLCFLLVGAALIKTSCAFGNINTIYDSFDKPEETQKAIDHIKSLPTAEYRKERLEVYTEGFSYGGMMLTALGSILLFKVGYKIEPWGVE